MRAALLVAVLLAGCRSWFGLDDPMLREDAPATPIDAPPLCLGTDPFRVCLPSAPIMPLTLTATIDTDNCMIVDRTHGTPAWCVMAGTNVKVSGDFRAQGTMPLVLFASDELSIDGRLDVAAHALLPAPAGGNSDACPVLGEGMSSISGGGGGAGGSFGSLGGRGGSGAMGMSAGAAPNDGMVLLSVLRGGCAGSLGGAGTNASGQPGGGGGAVYLLAGGSITVGGLVNASGAGGGNGTASKGGGSGGGSGGLILLSAPTITINGSMFANGGGGGGGADNFGLGTSGEDPMAALIVPRGGAAGGTTSCGTGPGCGGNGAFGTTTPQAGGNDATGAGGGGGGGGIGYIRVLSGQALNGMISPAPMTQ